MKELFFSRYGRLGASSRLRMYQYLPTQGVQVTVTPFFDDEYPGKLYNGWCRSFVREGMNGFPAGTNVQWVQALLELGINIHLANTMGCSGRRIVEQSYHCDRVAPMIFSVLNSMMTLGLSFVVYVSTIYDAIVVGKEC